MRKINLKATLLSLAALFIISANAENFPTLYCGNTTPARGIFSVTDTYSVCKPSSVTLGATYTFYLSTPSTVDSYKVVTEFWRYDIGYGACYAPVNGELISSVSSGARLIPTGVSILPQDSFKYGIYSYPRNSVNKSGYYQAKSFLMRKTSGVWGLSADVSLNANPFLSEWTREYSGEPGHCCLVAPYIEIAGRNQDTAKFSINGIYVETQPASSNAALAIGNCHDIIMNNIGGNGTLLMIVVERGTGGGLLFTPTKADTVLSSVTLDINHRIPDQNLSTLFDTFITNYSGAIRIRLAMQKNSCDASGGYYTSFYSRTYNLSRPSTPTIGTLQLNGSTVITSCTSGSVPTVCSADALSLSFGNTFADSVWVYSILQSSCGDANTDTGKLYIQNPATAADIRNALPSGALTTGGKYKIYVRTKLCTTYVNSTPFYVNVVTPPQGSLGIGKIVGGVPTTLGAFVREGTTSSDAGSSCLNPLTICNKYFNIALLNAVGNTGTFSGFKIKLARKGSTCNEEDFTTVFDGTTLNYISNLSNIGAPISDWSSIETKITEYTQDVDISTGYATSFDDDFYNAWALGGTYKITVLLYNTDCSATPQIYTIYVLKAGTTMVLGCKTAEEDEVTDIEDIANKNGIVVYPNPATSTIQIEATNGKALGTIEVYDNLGRVVYEQENIKTDIFSVDVSRLSSAVYNYQLKDSSGKTYFYGKFLKQ